VFSGIIGFDIFCQEEKMELLAYDDDKNVSLKLTEKEFLEICDILCCVANDYQALDPTLLMVEKERVSLLDDDIHAVLKQLNIYERQRHGS
jgi:hypothetical protein